MAKGKIGRDAFTKMNTRLVLASDTVRRDPLVASSAKPVRAVFAEKRFFHLGNVRLVTR
jgi:hypothetical protein